MPKIILLFLVVFLQSSLYSQKDFILLKADESNIIIDGVLSKEEKSIGVMVPIEYEQEPSPEFDLSNVKSISNLLFLNK